MSDKIYSEQEVASLIRRAVELESERGRTGQSGTREGLTIHDLEKIAADAGIDPELMREAAEELRYNMRPKDIDIEDTTTVNDKEIVAEHWVKGELTPQILDNLIIELNQRFGTSQEEINWWNTLFNDYSGKALVNKTATSADWKYTDDFQMYTTRALIQQRGDKLRIRVSKRQAWNLSWKMNGFNIGLTYLCAVLFITAGGVLGVTVLDSALQGILGGLTLSALLLPTLVYFNKLSVRKHKRNVTDIAENLVIQAKQMVNESNAGANNRKRSGSSDIGIIELDSGQEKPEQEDEESPGRLRNHLRG